MKLPSTKLFAAKFWHIFETEKVIEIEYVGPKSPDLYAYLGLARPEDK